MQSLKPSFRSLPRRFRILMVRVGVSNFVFNMNPYNSIYVLALGASATQLGLLTSIGTGVSAAFSVLTGWISDRWDRKTMFLIGAALGILVPTIYLLAPSMVWLIPAFILYGVSDGILQPPWSALYANSVKNENRGAFYGIANFFTLMPTLFAGLVGGAIVASSGGLNAEGIRPVYLAQASLLIFSFLFVLRFLEREDKPRAPFDFSVKNMVEDYRRIMRNRGVRSWVLMKSLGSVSIGLADPFWMLYAAVVHKASAMTMAYMVTVRTVTNIVLSPIAGKYVDRFGRKKMIISGRGVMYLATIVFIIFGGEPYLLLAWVLMGVNDATGIAWSAKEVELVDEEDRSKITALSHASFNSLAVPASILGGFLWDSVSPIAPFLIMMIIDGGIRMQVIHKFVPESNNSSKHEPAHETL
ncbi:MFS transporter [Candidatus Bathyarchaeota archaeon]|nr:MFS transporter [Candidatus Bathyarchaeota archaeon]